jgi:hypothetical protein
MYLIICILRTRQKSLSVQAEHVGFRVVFNVYEVVSEHAKKYFILRGEYA